jgi:hypothetical protein
VASAEVSTRPWSVVGVALLMREDVENSSDQDEVDAILAGIDEEDELRSDMVATRELTDDDRKKYYPIEPSVIEKATWDLLVRFNKSGPYSFLHIKSHKFEGQGVYALYYHGVQQAYEALTLVDKLPIYVGKSISNNEQSVWNRLVTHFNTIKKSNMKPREFTFRFIRLPADQTTLFEEIFIELYYPIWNEYLTGFGCGPRFRNWAEKKGEEPSWLAYHALKHSDKYKTRPSKSDIESLIQEGVTETLKRHANVMDRLQSI